MSLSPIFGITGQNGIVIGIVVAVCIALYLVATRKKEDNLPAPKSGDTDGSTDLFKGLQKTREEGFLGRITGLFKGRVLDDDLLEQIEEVLLTSDIGVKTSDKLLSGLKEAYKRGEVSDLDSVWGFLRQEAIQILESTGSGKGNDPGDADSPQVILMVGVNGTGKTTTTGKLAAKWKAQGRNVLLGAGDTFRAAAVEQLQAWGSRVDVPVIAGKADSDPASVLFDAAKKMEETKSDILIADTAGRLHTHAGLLDELKKVVRVIGKARPGAPQEVWLVLDGTTGQNAIQQARIFGEAVQVTGLILTKLDGTAKGGVVLGISDELGLPIRYIGIGEKVDDLRPFKPREFVRALFGDGSETK